MRKKELRQAIVSNLVTASMPAFVTPDMSSRVYSLSNRIANTYNLLVEQEPSDDEVRLLGDLLVYMQELLNVVTANLTYEQAAMVGVRKEVSVAIDCLKDIDRLQKLHNKYTAKLRDFKQKAEKTSDYGELQQLIKEIL